VQKFYIIFKLEWCNWYMVPSTWRHEFISARATR